MTVYSGKRWRAGFLAESTLGTNNGAAGNYVQLPLETVKKPRLNPLQSGVIRSGNEGMIKHDDDNFRNVGGGNVIWDFEMPAEREFLSQFLAMVLQNHAESGAGPYIHTMNYGYTGGSVIQSRPNFLGAVSDGIPGYGTIAIDGPVSGQGILLTSAILQSLTLEFDQNNHEGRAWLSGSFFSGFTSSSKYQLEQTLSGTWVKRTQNYFYPGFTTKTLDVDAGAGTAIIIPRLSLTIAPTIGRVGRDANGDAEDYYFGTGEEGVKITGSMDILYDTNVDLGADDNPVQDFIDKSNMTLTLQIGDGTVSTAGEMNIALELQYTGDPDIDLEAEGGALWNMEFEVVQATSGGSPSNTDALKVEIADSTADTAW